MVKIIINNTISTIDIKDTGVTIPASGQYIISPQEYQLWSDSTNIIPYINSEDCKVNDGTRDLSITEALEYLVGGSAFGTRFENDDDRSNGFDATNTQEAVEELRYLAAPLRVPISLIYNGTVSNGTFMGYSNLLPGDATPVIVPISGLFVEFTWANKNSNADFALEFRRNSTTATPFFTWSVDNTDNSAVVLPTSEPFTIGDQIYIKYIDQGSNAQDAAIVLLFKA